MTADAKMRPARKMPAQKPGRSVQTYATPRPFLEAVKRRFTILEFAYDLAAEPETTAAKHFYCEEENSLAQDWTKIRGDLWLNPPFGSIAPWAEKCRVSRSPKGPRRIFFLTPASIGSNWFAADVWNYARVFALQGRLSFDGRDPYPKDLILSVYGLPPGFEIWDVRDVARQR
jgi:site-specific DNA-methyltransferase (adenine-specific)